MTQAGPIRKNLKVILPHGKDAFKPEDMPDDVVPILGLDPGGVTGWSLLVLPKTLQGKDIFSHPLPVILSNKITWEHGELSTQGFEDEAVYQLSKIVRRWPSAAIVVEDFILRVERKEKSRELLSPVRLTAKLETYLWGWQRKMFLQQPADAKNVVTNQALKIWGCLVEDGVTDHARDADRHAILFVRRCLGIKGAHLKLAAWPHLYADGDVVVPREELVDY